MVEAARWPWLRPTWLSPCRLTSDAVLLTSNDEHSERAGYHFKSNRNGKSGKNWSAAEFSVFLNMPCFDFYVMTQGSLCQAVFFKNSNYKWHSQAPILLVFISNILCFSTHSHFIWREMGRIENTVIWSLALASHSRLPLFRELYLSIKCVLVPLFNMTLKTGVRFSSCYSRK